MKIRAISSKTHENIEIASRFGIWGSTKPTKVQVGEIQLVYVSETQEIVALLQVIDEQVEPVGQIWSDNEYPYRYAVKVLYKLPAGKGVSLKEMQAAVGYKNIARCFAFKQLEPANIDMLFSLFMRNAL